jgi:hypothetical protein
VRVELFACGVVALGSTFAFAADLQSPPSRQATVDAILSEPLPGGAYSAPKECIDLLFSQSVRTEVLDSSHILFYGLRGQIWLNRLRSECAGLAQNRVLVFGISPVSEAHLCRTDRFRSVDRYGWGPPATVPCILGDFQPISQAQADALRVALRERPKVERAEKKPNPGTTPTGAEALRPRE